MSGYNVWVGGLKGVVQERDLTEIFQSYGRVLNVRVVRDPETKKSKHCAFVVYGDENTAEYAARQANGRSLMGSTITTRGPAEQERRGHPSKYTGKTGYVPTKNGDKRPYTDCCHYASGSCNNSPCPYRHSLISRNFSAPVCERWLSDNCKDVYCVKRHPGPNAPTALAVANDPVDPIYRRFGSLRINDDDDIVQLASKAIFDRVKQQFKDDWAQAKGEAPSIKAVFVIQNQILEDKWKAYKTTLPGYCQHLEEYHYHGTKLCCNISSNVDLCTSGDCSICRISERGFSELKIRQNIPHYQRFGRGFYLAPKSSKCHDYTQGAYTYRAMLLCRVCPGNKYKLKKDDTSLQGPPEGFHSIYGETGASLNYEEIVLPKPDAILPKYIIVYRKDGMQKIAK